MKTNELNPRKHLHQLAAWCAAVLVTVLGLSLFVAGPSHADELDDRLAKAKHQQTQSKAAIDDLKDELSETDKELADAYLQLKQAESQLPVAEANLSIANKEYQEAQREADNLAQKLSDAQDEKSSLEDQISQNEESMKAARSGVVEMARQAARGDLDMTSLGLIVGAESTDDYIQRYNMNTAALRSQSKSLDKLRQARAISANAQVRLGAVNDIITGLKEEADAKVLDTQAKYQKAEDAKSQVEHLIAQQQDATSKIEGRKQAAEQQLKEEQANSASLSDEIRKIAGLQEKQRKAEEAAEAKRKADELKRQQEEDRKNQANHGSSGSGSSGSTTPPPSSGGSSSGWFSWPTQYRVVTSSYGWRLHPILGYYRLHAGTDMRAYCGTEIRAGRAGTVVWAQWKTGFGNQVMLNHGTIGGANVMSSYNHLTRSIVHPGQQVSEGQLLGYAGNTGLSGACHLHFEVYVNGSTVNPMTKMK